MKPRKVIVTLELETDLPLDVLRDRETFDDLVINAREEGQHCKVRKVEAENATTRRRREGRSLEVRDALRPYTLRRVGPALYVPVRQRNGLVVDAREVEQTKRRAARRARRRQRS